MISITKGNFTMKLHFYTVTGSGHFPLDMLRYDGAAPDDSNTVGRISSSIVHGQVSDPKTEYNLVSCQAPTMRRWQSFGFEVTNYIVRRKIW